MGKWTPLLPAVGIRDKRREDALIADAQRAFPKATEEGLRKIIEDEMTVPVFRNLDYQVAMRKTPTGQFRLDGTPINIVHLSIRRIDRKPIRDWRDLQRIKNELVGPECEMVEIFPAESRLIDTANQFHLWGLDDPEMGKIAFGWHDERAVNYDPPSKESGAVQRGAPR